MTGALAGAGTIWVSQDGGFGGIGMLDWVITDVFHNIENLFSPDWYRTHWVALVNVMIIDITLAGDNAIVVGMAASQVAPEKRAKVIFWGITAAVILRILFALITVQLLAIVGLTLAGGILLLWVCWKMYRQIVSADTHAPVDVESGLVSAPSPEASLGFGAAIFQIALADISMSLDNVLAVAGAAKDEPLVLFIGLIVSIILMAIAAKFIAGLLVKQPWIAWIGLLIILWVALDMIYSGSREVACQAYDFACSESLFEAIRHRLGMLWS